MHESTHPIAPRRSWLAHLSAGLGLAALLGVLCFHFPEQLTSRDFRAAYSEAFARHLLLFGLVAAFATALAWGAHPLSVALMAAALITPHLLKEHHHD